MIKTFFRSSLVVLLLILIIAVSRSVYTQATKFQEIHKAESKATKLVKENKELKEELKGKQGNLFIEKQARDKLGFRKAGEVLYVLPKNSEPNEQELAEKQDNWQKWLELLFW